MNKNSKAAAWYRAFAKREGFAGDARPRAIVIVSAHWEESPIKTFSPLKPVPLLFDYYGFPKFTYELEYAAPGEVRELESMIF